MHEHRTPAPPYLQHLGDFVRAQLFNPQAAATAAAHVLLPGAEALPGTPCPPAWIAVADLVTAVGRTRYAAIYEVFESRLLHHLRGLSQDWPRLWREAVTVYVQAQYGVDLADDAQLQACAARASEALWEAHQAFAGAP